MDASLLPPLWIEILLVGILILLNGVFAAAEVALISARRSRIQQLAAEGDDRARRVAALQDDAERFLATVQIGITFIGTLASAVGGASAIRAFSPALKSLPIPGMQAVAEPLALALVVLSITYATLILGVLVPKSLGLRHAVRLALAIAGFI